MTQYEPMKVFRIEHPDSGKGPYTHHSGRGLFASDAMRNLAEPSEFKGVDLRHCSGYHFAFKDMDVLMWAVQNSVLLREYGFHFSVYESNEHLVLPDGQVAFVKDKAKMLASYQIHEFPFDDYF